MHILTKEYLRQVKERIIHRSRLDDVKSNLRRILKIQEELFWRCESPGGCAAVYSLSGELLRQVRLIEGMLNDLDEKEFDRAILKIDWYEENITIPDNEFELALIMAQTGQDEKKLFRDAKDDVLVKSHFTCHCERSEAISVGVTT